uniref:Photosystem I assembly protein Ycf4 n=1 Tax=Taenioma perpusillum TaxID=210852 RepID=A0A1Z1MRM5_9FLOR|nr:photosystem I assembly protein [Taenioma perpusillum]ARW68482.1 photosystem I assembly protein [Taenioma perpusillum]
MSQIKIDKIVGSRRFSNYWWATIIGLGGFGFFFTGLSSYLNTMLIPLFANNELSFLPQGAVITFYGTIGILLSIFLWYTIILNVGSGYNEFNVAKGIIIIFRLGFPGKNRTLKLLYNIKEINSIKVSIEKGFLSKSEIYIKMKDTREIPITKAAQVITISNIEKQAVTLSKFLGVKIEGLDN